MPKCERFIRVGPYWTCTVALQGCDCGGTGIRPETPAETKEMEKSDAKV
jgi:hypothetical protein